MILFLIVLLHLSIVATSLPSTPSIDSESFISDISLWELGRSSHFTFLSYFVTFLEEYPYSHVCTLVELPNGILVSGELKLLHITPWEQKATKFVLDKSA
mgnify:CR=1 FL=1